MATIQMPESATRIIAPLSAEEEAERRAFNRAFRELGLSWYWEQDDYRELLAAGDAAARVCRYVHTRQPALLAAYPAEFLAGLVSDIAERLRADTLPPCMAANPRGWTPGAHSVDYVA